MKKIDELIDELISKIPPPWTVFPNVREIVEVAIARTVYKNEKDFREIVSSCLLESLDQATMDLVDRGVMELVVTPDGEIGFRRIKGATLDEETE